MNEILLIPSRFRFGFECELKYFIANLLPDEPKNGKIHKWNWNYIYFRIFDWKCKKVLFLFLFSTFFFLLMLTLKNHKKFHWILIRKSFTFCFVSSKIVNIWFYFTIFWNDVSEVEVGFLSFNLQICIKIRSPCATKIQKIPMKVDEDNTHWTRKKWVMEEEGKTQVHLFYDSFVHFYLILFLSGVLCLSHFYTF